MTANMKSDYSTFDARIIVTSEEVPHPHVAIKTLGRKPAYGMWWRATDSDEEIGAAMRKFLEAAVNETEKIND